MDALTVDRFQFAFTISFHYLFPQLTMGLAFLIVVLKSLALWKHEEDYNAAARYWAKILGIAFAFGVATGVPMEFQFGTNWAEFSKQAGGIIGQTLAMEGIFAFFLESAFLYTFLFGEKRLGPRGHWGAAFLVFAGAWISGYFIIATNAWMQHPVAFTRTSDGGFQLASFRGLLLNPWLLWQYTHNMSGAVITGSFVMVSLGAYYFLSGRLRRTGRRFVVIGVATGCIFSILQLYPTGDGQGRMIAYRQPVTLAAMEALFGTEKGAPLVFVGQPNVGERRIDNPILMPYLLSFLSYRRWRAEVKGLEAFPRDEWPYNIPLLYYSYHIMVGLGSIFIAIMLVAVFLLWRRKLFESTWMMWILMLSFPFPFIANTAGWLTAELGRQPWVVYGLMRTETGLSPMVSSGNATFTLIGFMGMYLVLGMTFLYLMWLMVRVGPEAVDEEG